MRSVEISSFHLWISALTSDDEARLNVDLFRGYQALLRPIQSINDSALTVSIGLQLILLINVVMYQFLRICIQIIFNQLFSRMKKIKLFIRTSG